MRDRSIFQKIIINQFNSIQMSFIGTRKHTFTLPKQVSKRYRKVKNNKKTVVKGEYIYSWGGVRPSVNRAMSHCPYLHYIYRVSSNHFQSHWDKKQHVFLKITLSNTEERSFQCLQQKVWMSGLLFFQPSFITAVHKCCCCVCTLLYFSNYQHSYIITNNTKIYNTQLLTL